MKQILIIILALSCGAIGFFIGGRMTAQKAEARAIDEQYIRLLDDVAYSHRPLKLMKAGEQTKAEELLHARLGDSLQRYKLFTSEHPDFPANEHLKTIVDAQAFQDGQTKTSE